MIARSASRILLIVAAFLLPAAAAAIETAVKRPTTDPAALIQARQVYGKAQQQFGPVHPQTIVAGFALATELAKLGRYADAKPFYRTLEDTLPRVAAPDGPEMARLLADMASVWESAGEAKTALGYARRATELYEHHPASLDEQAITAPLQAARLDLEAGEVSSASGHIAAARARLATRGNVSPSLRLRVQQGAFEVALTGNRLEEARALAETIGSLAAAGGSTPVDGGIPRVRVLLREGRWQDAQDRLTALEGDVKATSSGSDLSLATVLYYRAFIFLVRSQYVEADALLRRALSLYEARLGGEHAVIARTLHNLALVYQELGEFDQADAYYQRALSILRQNFGAVSAAVANSQLEMVRLFNARHDYVGAERVARQGQRTLEAVKLPDERPLAIAHTALGYALQRQGRRDEAIGELLRALEYVRSARGAEATEMSMPLTHLAELYFDGGQVALARDALERALVIMHRDGMHAPTTEAEALMIRAKIAASESHWDEALTAARASSRLLESRSDLAGPEAQLGEAEQRIARPLYAEHAMLAYRYYREQPAGRDAAIAEGFLAAQGAALSSAARAVSQQAARFSQKAGELGDSVRRYQDLVQDLRAVERLASELLAVPPAARPADRVAQIESQMSALRRQVTSKSDEITARFPRYREFSQPRPIDVQRLQSTLETDEALIFQLTIETGTLIWLVSRDHVEMIRSDLDRGSLDVLVRRIRKTIAVNGPDGLQDFDTLASVEIYQRTIGKLSTSLDRFRHLLFVLDGPLQSLPPGLLLPHTPRSEDMTAYDRLPWLGVTHAISILPTAGSLVLLRGENTPSTATEPFGGFGNPLFGGPTGRNRSLDALASLRTGVSIDRGVFKRIPQLPETAVELETMRRLLGGRPEHLYLAAKATVRNVESAPLESFRVITFATHAIMAGEFPGVLEPAIVMAPGAATDPIDNGLLKASDIARLRLNADWVILSACNTAAPNGTPGADGLSGLAQSFLFAGARTLLVSHWAVSSKATVPLTTGTMERLTEDPTLSKSEALRRTLAEMVSGKIDPLYRHPAAWAPFVIVGDGGSRRPEFKKAR